MGVKRFIYKGVMDDDDYNSTFRQENSTTTITKTCMKALDKICVFLRCIQNFHRAMI